MLNNFRQSNTQKQGIRVLITLLFLTVIGELFFHRHSHFGQGFIDESVGFYAILAFLGSLLFLLISLIFGALLRVEEGINDD